MTAAPAIPPVPVAWAGPLRRSWMRGLTDREIAVRHGMHVEAVREWRYRGGLRPNPARWVDPGPSRPEPEPKPEAPRKPRRTTRQTEILAASNRARHEAATGRAVQAAWAILDSDTPLTGKYRAVLEARVADPWASLSEIAASTGMTKHAYAACLRRALIVHAVSPPCP